MPGPASLLAVLTAAFSLPRVDFDLHPGTLPFIIFCAVLTAGLLAAIVALGLYAERQKRLSAHHDQWIEETDGADVEPFVSDEATPDVRPSVSDLFDAAEPVGESPGQAHRKEASLDDGVSIRDSHRIQD